MTALAAALPRAALGEHALAADAIEQVSACISTTRAIRRFKREPVQPEAIRYVLDHAIRAGSGSNRQPWRFVVVDDANIRHALGVWYRKGWDHLVAHGYTSKTLEDPTPVQQRTTAAAERFAHHFEDAPVVIVPCFLTHPVNPADVYAGASIFTAVQNMLLAARSIGLGAVVTTMQAITFPGTDGRPTAEEAYYRELADLLAIPDGVVPVAVVPIGWPDERFFQGKRKPLSAVTFENRWGQSWGPADANP